MREGEERGRERGSVWSGQLPHPSSPSMAACHLSLMGYGCESVILNSRTLKVGESMAHWMERGEGHGTLDGERGGAHVLTRLQVR